MSALPFTPLGGQLYSHNAGMKLFSSKLGEMAVLSENFFVCANLWGLWMLLGMLIFAQL